MTLLLLWRSRCCRTDLSSLVFHKVLVQCPQWSSSLMQMLVAAFFSKFPWDTMILSTSPGSSPKCTAWLWSQFSTAGCQAHPGLKFAAWSCGHGVPGLNVGYQSNSLLSCWASSGQRMDTLTTLSLWDWHDPWPGTLHQIGVGVSWNIESKFQNGVQGLKHLFSYVWAEWPQYGSISITSVDLDGSHVLISMSKMKLFQQLSLD